jgi:hypothetical protein
LTLDIAGWAIGGVGVIVGTIAVIVAIIQLVDNRKLQKSTQELQIKLSESQSKLTNYIALRQEIQEKERTRNGFILELATNLIRWHSALILLDRHDRQALATFRSKMEFQGRIKQITPFLKQYPECSRLIIEAERFENAALAFKEFPLPKEVLDDRLKSFNEVMAEIASVINVPEKIWKDM